MRTTTTTPMIRASLLALAAAACGRDDVRVRELGGDPTAVTPAANIAAVASEGIMKVITDPRTLDMAYSRDSEPEMPVTHGEMMSEPLPDRDAREVSLVKGPNIVSLPEFEALPDEMELPVLLHLPDDISTDEIMPAGARTADAAELLESSYFEAMLAGAQAVYDLVVIDTPPLNVLPDTAAIVPHVDGVLVVVRDDVTDGDALELTLERLRRADGPVIGIVFNDVALPKQYAYGSGARADA